MQHTKQLIKGTAGIKANGKILVCFPFAGGGASTYNGWKRSLDEVANVYSVQLPGREDRIMEEPYKDMRKLVEDITEELCLCSNNAIYLFGHSMGAKIAYEVARSMEASGRMVKMLIVSGSRVPHILESNPIYNLPDEQFAKAIVRFDGIPKEILDNKELLKFFLPMLKADFTMDEKYHTTEVVKLSCPITAFGGISDKEADEEAMNKWQEYTKSHFKIFMFEGKHFFIRDKEAEILNIILHQIKSF
ncbi:thioesterase II family protein [Clostridium saccharobutylicum]|uniref:Gramicidin S biosynthesis protein GrsT n=1 Tax=Clostridium saccharobutylicum DSM 13864 TaxID=1345695 RepID=U5MQ19_CLOSA|nr:alpha/beta fold hydrolase [Clostridium saccharobutylicum]AGX42685.1 gramicidin S biosynthesis protein GrsT [Clostridium saccharobutylicum DSM 13864]AQR89977.1 linear gramicidin dehydrogenase LgrE [Clostridium saccharobutylicum]AQR99882.1 linear gramicidin dehydrogenase LgrE [Clostridium saccharobutylicum]AQS09610.1 linear gramicidin dehydrogenase LgrE [Clostridium saccharobutylicum]AQS13866.1 linear gramicidin dehydrogenase LgrE [Clostridium saccharobutylicum]